MDICKPIGLNLKRLWRERDIRNPFILVLTRIAGALSVAPGELLDPTKTDAFSMNQNTPLIDRLPPYSSYSATFNSWSASTMLRQTTCLPFLGNRASFPMNKTLI